MRYSRIVRRNVRRFPVTNAAGVFAGAAMLAPAPAAAFIFDAPAARHFLHALGLSRLDSTDITLIAIAFFIASAVFAAATCRVLGERTFGPIINTVLSFGGAMGGLYIYTSHAQWSGGPNFGLSALACLTGALTVVMVLSAVKNWVSEEAGAVMAGEELKKPTFTRASNPRPSQDRVRSVLARRNGGGNHMNAD